MKKNEDAINWITKRLRELADTSKVPIESLSWTKQDNGTVFVVEIHGARKKTAAKLFDNLELARYPLSAAEQISLDNQLTKLIQFLKTR